MFEISGVTLDVAKQALSRAAHKLPVKSRVVLREEA
jgi:large subunit ribosomal protein L16